MPTADQPVLFFDGVCNLCNGVVQFIIRHDKKKRFLFASLQSEAGKKAQQDILKKYNKIPDSIILYHRGKYHIKSSAALRISWLLGGGWSLMAAGLIIPAFFRNIVYDWVARNRYKWFGKQDECMIPTPELKSRFL